MMRRAMIRRSVIRRIGLALRFGLVTTGTALPTWPSTVPRQTPVQTSADADGWNALRAQDLRLATILYRLTTANTAHCDRQMPATGLALQAIDQFQPDERDAARAAFRFAAPLSVEAVAPGSPAERAGIAADSGVTTINGERFDAPAARRQTTQRRDRAETALTLAAPDRPIRLGLLADGRAAEVTIIPVPACRARIELVTTEAFSSQADDTTIQLGVGNLARFDDDELAVLVAHELAHVVLHHTERLNAAGVHRGLLGEFGANARAIRAVEDEADRFSLHLLAAAGYDPELGPGFWRGAGRSLDPGFLRDATHASPNRRAAMMEEEIGRMRAAKATPAP